LNAALEEIYGPVEEEPVEEEPVEEAAGKEAANTGGAEG